MAKTFRYSKVMKFIDHLRSLRKKESDNAILFGNHLKEQFAEILEYDDLALKDDVYKGIVDKIVEESYKSGGISFSHSQFSFFHSTMFHLGSTQVIDTIIKEMGEFFDLDIPERRKSDDEIEKYQIKSVDTLDYSNFQREYLLIIGGLSEGHSDEVRKKCYNLATEVLLKFIEKDKIEEMDKGFKIKAPLQIIPDMISELSKNGLGVYGVIPIEDADN